MAVFYADSAGTQGTGDGSTAGNACTLKQFIEDDVILHTALAAGDVCYVKNGTEIVYDGSAGVYATFSVAGTAADPVLIIGYNSTITDRGMVEMRDSDAGATGFPFDYNNLDYQHLYNFQLTDIKRFEMGSVDGYMLSNVDLIDPVDRGFDENGGTGAPIILIDCLADGAIQTSGYDINHRNALFINCIAKNCEGHGFDVGSNTYAPLFIGCISSKNKGNGYITLGSATFKNSIADGNDLNGISVALDGVSQIINCGLSNNGGYAVSGVSGGNLFILNTGMYLNTSGTIDPALNVLKNEEPQTGNPLYTNQGTGDYTLQAGSPWVDSGNGYNG
jgi:hypothetical protein